MIESASSIRIKLKPIVCVNEVRLHGEIWHRR